MTKRRGSRPATEEQQKILRASPKSAGVSDYRKAMIQEEIEQGSVVPGGSYEGSHLQPKMQKTDVQIEGSKINRGSWIPSDGGVSMGTRKNASMSGDSSKTAIGAIAHSESFLKRESSRIVKSATTVGSVGGASGTSAGGAVERLAPEVYSPLFTMANLNLPRDRITVNAWVRNFFQLHPIVRNAITLHATYPISKLNLKCHDRKVLQFHEDMVEEMGLMESVGDVALEYWKLGEKIQGSSLITMSDGTLKPICEVEVGDKVLTHTGNIKKVKTLFKKPTDVVIEKHLKVYKIHVMGVSEPLIISGKHPILTTKHDDILCETPSCKRKNVRVFPDKNKCSNCGKNNTTHTNLTFQFTEMNDVDERDLVYAPFNNEVVENESFNKDLCYMMGFWLAEGCYCKATSKSYTKYNGIKFTSYDKKYIDDVLKPLLLKCTSFEGTTYTSKSTHFAIGKNKYDHWLEGEKRNCPALVDFFLQHCGEYSKEKKLSQDIMLLPPELQLQLVAGFIDGDGCVDKSNGHIIIATSSMNLANQLILILRRIGIHVTGSSVEAVEEKNIAKKYRIKIPATEAFDFFKTTLKTDKVEKLYKPRWSSPNSALYENYQVLYIKKIEDITHNFNEEYMYDIEVEDDHSYIANGIAIHNCIPYAELNENTGKWSKIVIQNPDYVHIKKTVLSGEPIISLKPDAVLQRLVFSNNPADVQLRKQIPEKIIYHVRAGHDIPLDNFNVSHLKMLASPYDVRGTSIVVSAFKDLMLYDKLRECYSEDTEFLTESGFKRYDEITSEDRLGTLNPKTNELEYQNYTHRTKYNYNGDMYHFHGKKIDMLVTPNHRMWLSKYNCRKGFSDFSFIRADEVDFGCKYKAQAVADWQGMEAKGVNVLGKLIPINDYLEFLGYLISEGSVRFDEGKGSYCVALTQLDKSLEMPKMRESFNKIGDFLGKHISTASTESKNGNVLSFRFYSKELAKYFKDEIGCGAHNKRVPYWVKQLDSKHLEVILRALIDGDGSILTGGFRGKTKTYSYSTVSKQLADDVQELSFKCGYAPKLAIRKNGKGVEFYSIMWSIDSNVGKHPYIYERGHSLGSRGAGIDKVPYSGDVVCFTVPNSLLVVRRNGTISIQGNSKFAQADGLINPVTIIKVGGNTDGEYRATQEDIEYFRQIFEEAQYDKDFKLITHAGVSVERVGASGQVLEIAGDMELIIKNIYTGLMVPPAVVDTESAVYASASIGLEVLRQRYFNFRNIIARWLVEKIFAPISEIQGFYEFVDGKKRLIVPEIEWNQMNLYDLQDYIGNITGLVGSKQASLQTLYRSLGLSYEDERIKMRQEMIHDAVRRKEEQALSTMDLTELRGLDPEKEILEPVSDGQRESGGGAAGGGDMGEMPGGDMGGMPGGLPELAPPPGGELSAPGAGAPEGGGLTPPMGPGTPGAAPGGLGGI